MIKQQSNCETMLYQYKFTDIRNQAIGQLITDDSNKIPY